MLESLDGVPEALKGEYEQKDGKFYLKVDGDADSVFPGLAAAKKQLLAEKKAVEDRLKAYEGIDPERARQLMTDAEKLEADKLKAKGDWDARETQLKGQLAADLQKREQHFSGEAEKWKTREALLMGALEENLIGAQATAAIVAAGGSPELLLPHVIKLAKLFEEDGKFAARVVDEKGAPRIANVKGDPFTMTHLVDELKANPVFGRAFAASPAGGSGAPGQSRNNSGGKTKTRADFNQMAPADRAAHVRDGGIVID
ncbi:MAG TPA: hypothetical protein VJ302_30670 [Blastocatellia bacterium]|nr:hypothetical protein [Blastocatellia bacterium]